MPDISKNLEESSWTSWHSCPAYEKVLRILRPKEGQILIYIDGSRVDLYTIQNIKSLGLRMIEPKIGRTTLTILAKKEEDLNYFKLIFGADVEYALEKYEYFK